VDQENVHPGKIVSTSQEVEVQILEVDSIKRASRSSQADHAHPWEVFIEKYPPGTESRARSEQDEFGLFLGSTATSTAWCISRLDWKRPASRSWRSTRRRHGQGAVLDVDVEKERSRSASSSSKAILHHESAGDVKKARWSPESHRGQGAGIDVRSSAPT